MKIYCNQYYPPGNDHRFVQNQLEYEEIYLQKATGKIYR